MLPRVEQFVGARRSNANSLLHELRDVGQLQSFAVLPQSRPSYVRLPLLAAEPATRDRLVVDLRRAGIGATGSYPASIVDVPELRSILPPNVEAAAGRKVSSRILTLPTHPFVSPADLHCMVDVVRRALPVEAVKVSPQLVTN
jgi:dTDP-4-amino-4,6-dideoxygalactose transaminase